MRIALFVTCVNDTLFPDTGRAVVRLLERLGHEVVFPEAQTCCGQMHYNSGYRRDAQRLAVRFVETFGDADAVLVPSGSCAAMIRDNYTRLGEAGSPLGREAGALAPRVYDLTELLVDVLGVTDVGAYFPHTVTYHPTCHGLRVLGLGERPYTLLRAVRGLELRDLGGAAECCGFGGTFAMKNAEVSSAMGWDKARNVAGSGAEVLCAADNSCLMHIGGVLNRQRSGVRVMHLAEILASTEEEPAHT
ncbi:L-lactate dehydrogenase complex protein LldE [Lipingzhangella halophila]|uniref:L-lactate dehydrogenase complex protein LldE n=1 Tax=Lipingzhangella halophila TaxID=1783352 RepID=A0A7W7RP94_9ACTN|nr:(Fe-S)-binding protein [Lipingzhangella halophila]MBB4935123.1 L-lactate dehydrogenase complex protein LldE [Lipingzhangella halophila]